MDHTTPVTEREIEQCTDESDRATQVEEAFTDAALEAARERAKPEVHPDFDGVHCVDCDEPIPKPRLAMGKVRCVECQRIREHAARMFRHDSLTV
jgi:phage/conjugal plasmid C-4 type zinc finger TraR family protein